MKCFERDRILLDGSLKNVSFLSDVLLRREGISNLLLVFLTEVILYFSRHSEINLVELSSDVVKDEDRAVLLEAGAQQPVSPTPKARSLSSSPSIIR